MLLNRYFQVSFSSPVELELLSLDFLPQIELEPISTNIVKNLKKKKKKSLTSKDNCDFCGKMFTSSSKLEKHLLQHTEQSKPFKCVVCKKCFTRKPNLRRHFLIHTGEKLYECLICDEGFTRKDYLDNHLKKHHKFFH